MNSHASITPDAQRRIRLRAAIELVAVPKELVRTVRELIKAFSADPLDELEKRLAAKRKHTNALAVARMQRYRAKRKERENYAV